MKRLGTDHLDLYLLHWRGGVPPQETVDALHVLQHTGLIRHWSVSNFDLASMQELVALPGGADVTTNQVLYNLTRRGIEHDLTAHGAREAHSGARRWLTRVAAGFEHSAPGVDGVRSAHQPGLLIQPRHRPGDRERSVRFGTDSYHRQTA